MAAPEPAEGAPAIERVLDNPAWWSLTGAHRHLAERLGRAVRYRDDVSVFSAVETFDDPVWDDLERLAGPGGEIGLLRDHIPPTPSGWTETVRGIGQQMLVGADGLAESEPVALRPLTNEDIPQMLALVDLTIPGPFLARTIETGRYVGHFDGDQLVSMAGERFRPDGFTEVSAVCTHPRFRKRGLGSSLTHHVASTIIDRGELPFLHVAETNDRARRVYERLGWVVRRPITFAAMRAPG